MGKKKIIPKQDYSELPKSIQNTITNAIKQNDLEWGSALTDLGLVPKPVGELTYSSRHTPQKVAYTFDRAEATSVLEEQDRCLALVLMLKRKEITMEECIRLIRTNQMQKLRNKRQATMTNGGAVRRTVGLI